MGSASRASRSREKNMSCCLGVIEWNIVMSTTVDKIMDGVDLRPRCCYIRQTRPDLDVLPV